MKPDISEQVNTCFDRDPEEALKTYSPEMVFDHLFVKGWYDLVRSENMAVLDCLMAVSAARGVPQQHSMWQLIASGVAQHQAVTVLEKYGCNLPLGPYLRECIPPFTEEFFTILPQYVSPSIVRASRPDIAEYFDMVQQKELLTEQTKDLGSTSRRKL